MPSLLFVCTANRCRSPMATGLIHRMLTGQGIAARLLGAPASAESVDAGDSVWHISSAGTWTRNGLPALREAIAILGEKGIDLTWHRSRVITAEIVERQDLILVMETGHREALQQEFPHVASRIHLLTAMAGPAFDVSDPVGGPLDDYRTTANLLETLLDQGWPNLLDHVHAAYTSD